MVRVSYWDFKNTKNIKNMGNKGTIYQIYFCAKIISLKLKDPAHKTTAITMNPIETSYEIICAALRIPPKKAYRELLAQPDKVIP